MGYGHDHNHHSGNIKTAFFLNFGFTLIEIVGGLLTNSMAILADAIHDLGDSISLGMAWYFDHLAHRERTDSYSYGYKRFSVVGAIINAIILLSGSIYIIIETIPRLINPANPDALGMVWLAILGVLVNGAAVFKLKKGHTINEKVVYLHLLEDVLGWIAVLMGALIMHFFDAPIIDPILSLAISAFILVNVFKNFRSVFSIIMQGVPDTANLKEITTLIKNQEQVHDVHDLHIWSMDGEYNVLTAHIVVPDHTDLNKLTTIKQSIARQLVKQNIHHTTLEFEKVSEQCDYEAQH